jgi:glutaredoxin
MRSEKMEKENLAYLTAFAVLIIFAAYGIISWAAAPGSYDDFAKCLTEKGIVMYGTDWCPHCKEQKTQFGKSFSFVDYRNCDFKKEECDAAGVKGYPTWVINGKNYPGTRSLEELAKLSGCNLG